MTPRAPAASFAAVLERRFSRRGFMQAGGSLATVAAVSTLPLSAVRGSSKPPKFEPVAPQLTDAVVLPKGYVGDLLIRWGDSLFADTPDLTPEQVQRGFPGSAQGARNQFRQFGINCDGLAFFPRAGRSDAGILCVNNEYTQVELMFSGRKGRGKESAEDRRRWILEHPHAVDAMKAAQGVSVIEVVRQRGGWKFRRNTPLTRRVTAETLMEITGPARGSPYMRTKADPEGVRVRGTMANCACGTTPWGTYLTCEENVDDYFGFARSWADSAAAEPEIIEAYRRFPVRERGYYGWEHIDPRFDVRVEPHEALRFGWVVEIDPQRPGLPPRKRTALGRFQHEGANTMLARDNRVAAYLGDDDHFEYVYKFVTRGRFDPRNPDANRDLLDEGTLYVARFDADGTGEWLPLVHDEKGPLNRAAGFASQADVVVKARAAADLLGATPLDRPEDIQPSQSDGRVYISCTNNVLREPQGRMRDFNGRTLHTGPNAANPRGPNRMGHIIELIEEDGDAAATRFTWNVFLLAGNPAAPGASLLTRYEDVAASRTQDSYYAGFTRTEALSPFACPDNLGLDPFGRLWIVTDSDEALGANDGCYVCPRTGPERGLLTQLMSAPVGSEVCGCDFTPDGTTMFLSIQHPGAGGTVDEPISHWPDGGGFPARPAVVAVRREDGDPL